jgi:hypothetical protein
MSSIRLSIAVVIAVAVCVAHGDSPAAVALTQAARAYGDSLAEHEADWVSELRAKGKDDKAIQGSLIALVVYQGEAEKEGYISSDDQTAFAVFAGLQCAYRLGATPKHPPGFDTPPPVPVLDSLAVKDAPATTELAVKITSNRWESYNTNDSGRSTKSNELFVAGTLTNTSTVPVTVTKMSASGFSKDRILVGYGSDYTIGSAEIAPSETVKFKMLLVDAQKTIRFVVVTPYIAATQ